MALLKLACKLGLRGVIAFIYKTPKNEVIVAGLKFPNRVGLAAGFDKDARWLHELSALGFGHIEVGTVTPKPQSGNPKPRVFRLKKDEALINRMGFNNAGVEAMKRRLKSRPSGLIVGGNIGKNKTTPNEEAYKDYEFCFRELYGCVDYFTVNVSSPNTPGLRELQDKEPLLKLLNGLMDLRKEYISNGKPSRPIFLKIAPDLTNTQLDEIVEITLQSGIDGLVATNTTINRVGLKSAPNLSRETGGLSGKPIEKPSTEVVAYLHQKSEGRFPIIGVGGISSAADAKTKTDAGASLVQVYTGFIYQGPGIAKQVLGGVNVLHLPNTYCP